MSEDGLEDMPELPEAKPLSELNGKELDGYYFVALELDSKVWIARDMQGNEYKYTQKDHCDAVNFDTFHKKWYDAHSEQGKKALDTLAKFNKDTDDQNEYAEYVRHALASSDLLDDEDDSEEIESLCFDQINVEEEIWSDRAKKIVEYFQDKTSGKELAFIILTKDGEFWEFNNFSPYDKDHCLISVSDVFLKWLYNQIWVLIYCIVGSRLRYTSH